MLRMPGSGIELGQSGCGLVGETGIHGSWILLKGAGKVVAVPLAG
jgi:hypothetical protein